MNKEKIIENLMDKILSLNFNRLLDSTFSSELQRESRKALNQMYKLGVEDGKKLAMQEQTETKSSKGIHPV